MKKYSLKEVCSYITDGSHGSPKSVDTGLPMASVKDLTPYGISLDTCRFISKEDFEKLVKQGCKPIKGDVLIAKDGNSALDTVCEIKDDIKVVLLSSVAILRPDQSKITSAYLRYYLDCDSTRKYMKSGFITGAAIPRVVLEDFKKVIVNIPPLPTQQKTAAILSAYDDLIENNIRRIRILEEMAQALYCEWFINFRFSGHEGVRMVESKLGPVPEGWEVRKLKDVCSSINYGYTTKAIDEQIGPKFLRITDIAPNQINWDLVPYCEISETDFSRYQLLEGDIVIARTGATSGYAKRINKQHPKAIFASYLVRIRINKEISNHYIGLIVESEEYKKFIKTNLSGSAQPQANAQVLTSIYVLIPPKDILSNFDSILSKNNDMKELLQMKNANLRRTRDLLLPKLISCDIDVSGLDIRIPEAEA